jgi:GTP-binding protein
MKLPVVAIVGRPNVGKSSLLNRFAGERIAIVDPTPGVTRDRVSALVAHGDAVLEVVDTGGIGIVDRDDLGEHVERQIEFALRGANVVLFVVDARDGLVPLDRQIAERLRARAAEVPFFLVVNKVDSERQEAAVHEFHALGLGEPRPVSAQEGWGCKDLLDEVVARVWPAGEPAPVPVMRLAVVGRRNVGKSTFVNALLQEERMIVSEVPGTTRDAVDVRFEKDGREFVVIDTAGMQRRKGLKDSIEFYSQVRALHAVQRADVVLFLLDATEDVTRADKKLAETIAEANKICVLVANKWDLTQRKMSTQEYAEYLAKSLPGLAYAPVACTTAKDGRNVQAVIDLAQNLYKRASRRATTGELNRVIAAIVAHRSPPARRSKVPRIYYGTQVGAAPPVFALFVNEPELFSPDYRRYVAAALREALGYEEIPVRVVFRRRESIYHD